MDIQLFARVIWRFKIIFLIGTVLSVALAAMSMLRVDLHGGGIDIKYRQSQVYESDALIAVTQPGFPWGRATMPLTPTSTYADPGRLSYLATFYSQLARSDEVRREIASKGARGAVSAAPLTDASGRNALPFITITGAATSATDAITTAQIATRTLISYIEQQQSDASIPAKERAVLTVVDGAAGATVSQPRKKTLPIFIFLALMTATVGLILVLENLRPRMRSTVATSIPLQQRRESAVPPAADSR
jgi:hypothetical protein